MTKAETAHPQYSHQTSSEDSYCRTREPFGHRALVLSLEDEYSDYLKWRHNDEQFRSYQPSNWLGLHHTFRSRRHSKSHYFIQRQKSSWYRRYCKRGAQEVAQLLSVSLLLLVQSCRLSPFSSSSPVILLPHSLINPQVIIVPSLCSPLSFDCLKQ